MRFLSQPGNKFDELSYVAVAAREGKRALRRLQRVPERRALTLRRAFRAPHEVRSVEAPRRHGQYTRASDIVRGLIDQAKIGDDVPGQAM